MLACCLKRYSPVYPKSSGFTGRREAAEAAQQQWGKEGLEPGSSSATRSGTCESICLSVLSIFVCNELHKADANSVVSWPLCFGTAICKAVTLCCSSGLSNQWAALLAFWERKELNLHKGLGMRWYPKTQSTCTSTSTGGAAVVCKGVLSHAAPRSVPK